MVANLWEPFEPTPQEPWDRRRAAHLIRRAGFGGTVRQIDELVAMGLDKALEKLRNPTGVDSFEAEMAPLEKSLVSRQEPQALASWWLLRMAKTPHQLLEKATFFWHGHFATSVDKVADSTAMLHQYRLLREHALGRFELLVQGISRNPAMLIYLDSTDNRKTRPNENYARELLELFCLGAGNYSERDIKELARCFTGWEVRQNQFQFKPHQHDSGIKTIFDQSGPFGGEDAVRIVLRQPAAARYIARKLVRFFCTDEDIADEELQPLAESLRANDFEIGQVLEMILRSRFFWSEKSIGKKVRGPVDLAIGLIRLLDLNVNMNDVRNRLAGLGQLPMFPPNVKGWEGGTSWINASTFIERINLAKYLADRILEGASAPASFGLVARFQAETPRRIVEDLIEVWFAQRPPLETERELIELASQGGQASDMIRRILPTLAAIPEFHLA